MQQYDVMLKRKLHLDICNRTLPLTWLL